MWRKVMFAFVVGVFSLNLALAETYNGKVKSVDSDKNTITVTIGDADKTFTVDKDAKLTTVGKKKQETPLAGLSAIVVDRTVTLTTEKKEDKEVVTAIKMDGKKKKKGA